MTTGTTGALAALSPSQLDGAEGVLLVQACGDALGVPWELGHSPTDSGCGAEASEGFMQGGGLGPYAPGEWSDDTQMSVIVARVAATGADLTSRPALDAIADGFIDWYASTASDIGIQTRAILKPSPITAASPASRRGCVRLRWTTTRPRADAALEMARSCATASWD